MEAISIAALEAMASGCVTAVSPVGGLAELVKDGETGIILPENLRLDCALSISSADRERMAEAAAAFVALNHSWEQAADQTFSVYKQVVAASVEDAQSPVQGV